jgi:nicotinamide-nucleotide adenylyltransferase
VRGLLVGRFQPFHQGHLAVVQEIRTASADRELILGVGSAQESYTWKNPFTSGERLEMIARALHEANVDRVVAIPLPDIERHALWVRYVESQLPSFDRIYTNNPLTRLLFEEAHYSIESPTLVDRRRLEGELVRGFLADDAGWKPLVPPAVGTYLEEIRAPARLATLREGLPQPSVGKRA